MYLSDFLDIGSYVAEPEPFEDFEYFEAEPIISKMGNYVTPATKSLIDHAINIKQATTGNKARGSTYMGYIASPQNWKSFDNSIKFELQKLKILEEHDAEFSRETATLDSKITVGKAALKDSEANIENYENRISRENAELKAYADEIKQLTEYSVKAFSSIKDKVEKSLTTLHGKLASVQANMEHDLADAKTLRENATKALNDAKRARKEADMALDDQEKEQLALQKAQQATAAQQRANNAAQRMSEKRHDTASKFLSVFGLLASGVLAVASVGASLIPEAIVGAAVSGATLLKTTIIPIGKKINEAIVQKGALIAQCDTCQQAKDEMANDELNAKIEKERYEKSQAKAKSFEPGIAKDITQITQERFQIWSINDAVTQLKTFLQLADTVKAIDKQVDQILSDSGTLMDFSKALPLLYTDELQMERLGAARVTFVEFMKSDGNDGVEVIQATETWARIGEKRISAILSYYHLYSKILDSRGSLAALQVHNSIVTNMESTLETKRSSIIKYNLQITHAREVQAMVVEKLFYNQLKQFQFWSLDTGKKWSNLPDKPKYDDFLNMQSDMQKWISEVEDNQGDTSATQKVKTWVHVEIEDTSFVQSLQKHNSASVVLPIPVKPNTTSDIDTTFTEVKMYIFTIEF